MGYYDAKLSGTRLRRCYEIAPPRVKRYLDAEIDELLARLAPEDQVLELGCGYGRVSSRLAAKVRSVVGIDTARESLDLAVSLKNTGYFEMNALNLDFQDDMFDAVVCVQNGICAFDVDQEALIREAARVTRPGGRLIFSTYTARFWPHRLEWFKLQADEGLVGEMDADRTGDGVIVCKDGFRAGTLSPGEFQRLSAAIGLVPELSEVDGSSLFCHIPIPG